MLHTCLHVFTMLYEHGLINVKRVVLASLTLARFKGDPCPGTLHCKRRTYRHMPSVWCALPDVLWPIAFPHLGMQGAQKHVVTPARCQSYCCVQIADMVSSEVQQQELDRCKRLLSAGAACRPVERMYAEMVVHGDGQESAADMTMALQDQLHRYLQLCSVSCGLQLLKSDVIGIVQLL